MKYDIVALYVCIDDFSKIYEEWENKKLIGEKRDRRRKGKLSTGEQLLIVILNLSWVIFPAACCALEEDNTLDTP